MQGRASSVTLVVVDEAGEREIAVDLLDAKKVAMLHKLGLVERLYPAFVALLPQQLATLRTALAAGDREAVVQLAHRVRGSAGQLGATALARALNELEDAVSAGVDARTRRADAALDDLLRTTTAALSREVEAARAR